MLQQRSATYRKESVMYSFRPGRSFRVLSLACGLLCGLAVAQDPPAAPPVEPAPPPAQAEAKKLTVTLLDAGAEPRRTLRYVAHVGQKGTLNVSMRMAMAMSMDGEEMQQQTLPQFRFTIVGEVKEIATNGDIHSRMEYTDVKVIDEPGVDPMMLGMMEEMCAGVTGMTAACIATSRGETVSVKYENNQDLDPRIAEQLTDLPRMLAQFGAILPEESVGQGARWRLPGPIDSGGMVINTSTDFTLAALSDTEMSLESTATQTADPQDVPIPDMPGQSLRLKSLKSDGGGKMRVRFDRPLGVEGEVKTETTVEMSFDLFGEDGTMKQRMSMTMTIAPGEAR